MAPWCRLSILLSYYLAMIGVKVVALELYLEHIPCRGLNIKTISNGFPPGKYNANSTYVDGKKDMKLYW